MRVLVGCEFSGRVRDAFIRAGHEACSCDLRPSESDFGPHIQCDIRELLDAGLWDALIVFPDCTYLCSSGLHWNKHDPPRRRKTDAALKFVRLLLAAPFEKIALENPVGCIGTRIRPADQYIQPYEFGENASKRTGLWLKGLPLLRPTRYIKPRIVCGRPRWANQTDSGQNRLGPSPTRDMDRGRTYVGIAEAMARQWGKA